MAFPPPGPPPPNPPYNQLNPYYNPYQQQPNPYQQQQNPQQQQPNPQQQYGQAPGQPPQQMAPQQPNLTIIPPDRPVQVTVAQFREMCEQDKTFASNVNWRVSQQQPPATSPPGQYGQQLQYGNAGYPQQPPFNPPQLPQNQYGNVGYQQQPPFNPQQLPQNPFGNAPYQQPFTQQQLPQNQYANPAYQQQPVAYPAQQAPQNQYGSAAYQPAPSVQHQYNTQPQHQQYQQAQYPQNTQQHTVEHMTTTFSMLGVGQPPNTQQQPQTQQQAQPQLKTQVWGKQSSTPVASEQEVQKVMNAPPPPGRGMNDSKWATSDPNPPRRIGGTVPRQAARPRFNLQEYFTKLPEDKIKFRKQDEHAVPYLNGDWDSHPGPNAPAAEQKQFNELHGMYGICQCCRALRLECSHAWPCHPCRQNGTECKYPFANDEIDCKRGIKCQELHEYQQDYMNHVYKPPGGLKPWAWPIPPAEAGKAGRKNESQLWHVAQLPHAGIAKPYNATSNPYGYEESDMPDWMRKEFLPPNAPPSGNVSRQRVHVPPPPQKQTPTPNPALTSGASTSMSTPASTATPNPPSTATPNPTPGQQSTARSMTEEDLVKAAAGIPLPADLVDVFPNTVEFARNQPARFRAHKRAYEQAQKEKNQKLQEWKAAPGRLQREYYGDAAAAERRQHAEQHEPRPPTPPDKSKLKFVLTEEGGKKTVLYEGLTRGCPEDLGKKD